MLEILKLLIENPGSGVVVVVVLVMVVFSVGSTWSSLHHMKLNMVTKKDLRLAIVEFREELREEFEPRHQR